VRIRLFTVLHVYQHPISLSYLQLNGQAVTRQNKHCQFLESIVENILFSVRIVKVWNSLPDELVTAKTIHLFKSFLENQNPTKFIVGKE